MTVVCLFSRQGCDDGARVARFNAQRPNCLRCGKFHGTIDKVCRLQPVHFVALRDYIKLRRVEFASQKGCCSRCWDEGRRENTFPFKPSGERSQIPCASFWQPHDALTRSCIVRSAGSSGRAMQSLPQHTRRARVPVQQAPIVPQAAATIAGRRSPPGVGVRLLSDCAAANISENKYLTRETCSLGRASRKS